MEKVDLTKKYLGLVHDNCRIKNVYARLKNLVITHKNERILSFIIGAILFCSLRIKSHEN